MKLQFRSQTLPLLAYLLTGGVFAAFYMVWLMADYPVAGRGFLFSVSYLWLFFTIAVYLVWTKFLTPRLASYSRQWQYWWMGGSLLIGVWLVDNIPVLLPGTGIGHALLILCAAVGVGLLLFAASVFFVTALPDQASAGVVPAAQNRRRWLVYSLPIVAVWMVYLLAFWPGMMSADSLDQWRQVITGQFSDHHPAFHTFTIWLLTRIIQTPAVVAIAQIVSLGLLAGAVFAYLQELGVNKHIVRVAWLVFALSPVNGTMVSTLWKDIPYSAAALAFTWLVLRIAISRGKWLEARWNWVLLAAAGALTALFRHNGLVVVLGAFPLLLVAFRAQWKVIGAAALACVLVYFGVTGPVYQLVGVEKSTVPVQAASSLFRIASNAEPGSQVDGVFQTMEPLSSEWQCSLGSSLYQANQQDAPSDGDSLPDKAANLARYSPSLLSYLYRCNRSLVWIVWDPYGEVRNPSHADYWIDPNPYGIVPASLIPTLQPEITGFVWRTAYNPSINWLVWRPALYLYLFLGVMGVAAIRQKNAWILLAAVPVLIQALGYTFIQMPPNFRYHYLIYLLALAFWPLLFIPRHGSQPQPSSLSME